MPLMPAQLHHSADKHADLVDAALWHFGILPASCSTCLHKSHKVVNAMSAIQQNYHDGSLSLFSLCGDVNITLMTVQVDGVKIVG